jgi:hypothetical protein
MGAPVSDGLLGEFEDAQLVEISWSILGDSDAFLRGVPWVRRILRIAERGVGTTAGDR